MKQRGVNELKKMTGLLIALVLTLGVISAACSKRDTPASSPAASSEAPAASSEAPAATETATETVEEEKPFKIRVGSWFIDDRSVMVDFKKNIEEAYKKIHPNGTIEWEITLGEPYFDKLTAQLASASGPDVFFHQRGGEYTEGGFLADLSDEPWKLVPSVHKSTVYVADTDEYTQYDGKIYGASMGVSVRGYWYNKKIFNDLGITAPKNTEEFFAAAEKIKQAGIIPLVLGFKDVWTASMFLEDLLQSYGYGASATYGRDLYDGVRSLEGPEVTAALQFFQTLKEKDYVNKDALSIDWPQSADLFTKGKAAIIMQGPWMPGTAADSFSKGAEPFELGYFPVMDDKGYYELSPNTDAYVSVNANTDILQQAKDLLRVILSPEVYAPYANGNGVVPAIEGIEVVYDNPAMGEVLPYVQIAPSHNKWEYYVASKDLLVEVVTKVVSGAKFTPADLKAVQKHAEDNKADITPPAEE